MSSKFGDLSTNDGLTNLNKHLENYSYIEGWTPTQSDVTTFKLVTSVDATKFPHVARWHRHISSFSAAETGAWPAGAASEAASATPAAPAAEKPAAPKAETTDEDFDLFGEDSEADKAREAEIERIKAEHEARKKAAGKVVVNKSSVILEVKPWDDTTDLKAMEDAVRSIQMDGLTWGAAKRVPIAFGLYKLQILATVVDDLCSVDELCEKIQELEDLVQSVDIAAFNKI